MRKNGLSLYSQLAQVQKSTGKFPEEYKQVEPPEYASYIWLIWTELRDNCRNGYNGLQRIVYTDIDTYQRIVGVTIPLSIVKIIQSMDDAYITEYNKAKE